MKLTKKTKILIAVAVGSLLLIGGAGAAWVVYKRRQRTLTPEEAYARGVKQFEGKRYEKAYNHLAFAAQQRPDNVEYNWAAARVALEVGQPRAALPYVQSAWDGGMRTAEVLLARAAGTAFKTPEDRLRKTLEWYGELPEEEATRDLEADLRYAGADRKTALRIWEEAFKTSPSPSLVNKIARTRIELNKPAEALEFLKPLAGTPNLDDEGYGWLGTLLGLANKLAEAEKAFAEGREKYPEGEKLRLREADFLMTQDRPDDTAAILDPMKARSDDPLEDLRHHRARLFLGAVLAIRSRKEKLDELETLAEGDLPWLEGERLFYRGLKEILAGQSEGAERIKQSRLLIAPHPAVEMIYAEALTMNRKWDEAVSVYRNIQGTLGHSPRVLLSFAQALTQAGQLDGALRALNRLHARRVYSKASLELFRDLAFRQNLTKEGMAAQKLLEAKFKDDPGVQLTGSLLALQSGRLDEAAAALQTLAEKHPERPDVQTAHLSVFVARKDYAGLLKECEKSSAPPAALAPFRARALLGLDRRAEALTLLQKAAESHPVPAVRLPLANLLLSTGNLEEAKPHFAAVLESAPSNLSARLGTALIDLRSGSPKDARAHLEAVISSGASVPYAHLLLAEIEVLEGQPNRALTSVHRVLAQAPDHPQALFLQAIAYIALGRLDDAEPILSGLVEKQPDSPNVRLHLARVKLLRDRPADALAVVDAALARKAIAESPARLPLARFRIALMGRAGKIAGAREALDALGDQITAPSRASLRARLFEHEGKLAEAAAELRPHLDLPSLAVQWAELSLRLGESAGVVAAVAPHSPGLPTWIRLAGLAGENGQAAASADAYREALKLDPENPKLLNNYAWNAMQAEAFDRSEVLAAARKAHTQLPTHPSVIHTYATALLKCDRLRDCVDLLQKDPASTRRTAKLLHVLARAHEARKEIPQAIGFYKECLNHPDTADVKEGELARPALQERIERLSNP